jgi:hypothetical protein
MIPDRNSEQASRMQATYAVARTALAQNRCPRCGAGVHPNLSIQGWVKCDRSGSGRFRRDPTGDPCLWQGFTE